MHHLLYHSNCADGFASAVIARHALTKKHVSPNEIQLQPVNYGDKNEQLPKNINTGDHIYYVDYTPPQGALDTLQRYGGVIALTIIDHHSTAAIRHLRDKDTGEFLDAQRPFFESVFSLTESGAKLTWNHFFHVDQGPFKTPLAISLIEWRDLGNAFQQKLDSLSTPAIHLHAALMRYVPRTHEAWLPMLLERGMIEDCPQLTLILRKGAMLCKADKTVIEAAADNPLWLTFPDFGLPIPALNGLGSELMSSALDEVLFTWPHAPFAASWYVCSRTGLFTYSLRSRKDGPNVAEIAAAMAPGGGGHPCAAGFSTPIPVPFAN